PYRRACRNVQAHSIYFCTIKSHHPVYLIKMKMRPYLYRPVSSINHNYRNGRSSFITFNGIRQQNVFPWYHNLINDFNKLNAEINEWDDALSPALCHLEKLLLSVF